MKDSYDNDGEEEEWLDEDGQVSDGEAGAGRTDVYGTVVKEENILLAKLPLFTVENVALKFFRATRNYKDGSRKMKMFYTYANEMAVHV